MSPNAAVTLAKMMETLPEGKQEQVLEHVRDYIAQMQDEANWDALFAKTQPQLAAAARLAKQQMAAGQAEPLDEGRL